MQPSVIKTSLAEIPVYKVHRFCPDPAGQRPAEGLPDFLLLSAEFPDGVIHIHFFLLSIKPLTVFSAEGYAWAI